MEIKDINVAVERLDDVRGGQSISVENFGLQVGGNVASSEATSYGLGNTTSSSVAQFAPQSFSQKTGIVATEVDRDVFTAAGSWISGYIL